MLEWKVFPFQPPPTPSHLSFHFSSKTKLWHTLKRKDWKWDKQTEKNVCFIFNLKIIFIERIKIIRFSITAYLIMCLSCSGKTTTFNCWVFSLTVDTKFYSLVNQFQSPPTCLCLFQHTIYFSQCLPQLFHSFPLHMSHSPLHFVLYHISILVSAFSISAPICLPLILFSITPTEPSVLFWIQACISISQCYLHVNSSSQIFTIVAGGETSSQGWDDSPFVNTISPK